MCRQNTAYATCHCKLTQIHVPPLHRRLVGGALCRCQVRVCTPHRNPCQLSHCDSRTCVVCTPTVAARIRRRVLEELGYTVSAGVAHNKMLAKLVPCCSRRLPSATRAPHALTLLHHNGCAISKQGSARNKPNQQTLLPAAAVPAFMTALPLRKIRFLGGKLGKVCTWQRLRPRTLLRS